MSKANQAIHYFHVESDQYRKVEGEIITETSVSLTVNGEAWLSFMCTPTDLEAMMVGFLYDEGLIESDAEVASVRLCPAGDNVDVWLTHSVTRPETWRRTSGCTGGITSVDAQEANQEITLQNDTMLTPAQVNSLVGLLFDAQQLYRQSGGVHTSALSDGQRILVMTEDIGRHNTLDKIAGRCLLEKISPARSILLTTGRISSEMMQKASRLSAAVVISRTSPSSLSIQMAERLGITLIGYARRNGFKIYAHPERVLAAIPKVPKGSEEIHVQ